jgi:uncharacterized protein
MKRTLYNKLIQWKNSSNRKPLILKGARQTGKTYLLTQFGKEQFSSLHYINFQQDKTVSSIFEKDLYPQNIIKQLEFYLDKKITLNSDILFFDEIQDCPRALTSLKYFCEDMPELALVCAGSLLGVVHSSESFPVGKVSLLTLHPLSFEEFLLAMEDDRGFEALRNVKTELPEIVHVHLMERLKEYMVTGGMPEVVETYTAFSPGDTFSAVKAVREKQNELLTTYMGDFSKYSGKTRANEIVYTFESLPQQLARENKKFVASRVIQGGRFSTLCSAIDWLAGAGLVNKVMICNSGELPFSAFTAQNRFKLYMFDTGLLGALAGLSAGVIMKANNLFATFKGAFCENFVAQEFVYAGHDPLYAWAGKTAEVEFIREIDGEVYPVEVKAGLSGKLKSLNVFAQKYNAPYRTRLSARNLEINENARMHSIPLYLAYRFPL